MLDLDHFNGFNNQFGHQAGDARLQAFGELLRTSIRAEDIACLYGGEEFTLILPEASLGVTAGRAGAIRKAVKDLRVQQRGQALGLVHGVAGCGGVPRTMGERWRPDPHC